MASDQTRCKPKGPRLILRNTHAPHLVLVSKDGPQLIGAQRDGDLVAPVVGAVGTASKLQQQAALPVNRERRGAARGMRILGLESGRSRGAASSQAIRCRVKQLHRESSSCKPSQELSKRSLLHAEAAAVRVSWAPRGPDELDVHRRLGLVHCTIGLRGLQVFVSFCVSACVFPRT